MLRQPASATASPEGSVDSFQLDERKSEYASGDPPTQENTEHQFLLPSVALDQPCTIASKPRNVASAVRSLGFSGGPIRRRYNHGWQLGYQCSSSYHSSLTSLVRHCFSRLRARAKRDMTVPGGMPAMTAISLYDNPSSSRRINTSRNSRGSSSIACLISWPLSLCNNSSSGSKASASVSCMFSSHHVVRSCGRFA